MKHSFNIFLELLDLQIQFMRIKINKTNHSSTCFLAQSTTSSICYIFFIIFMFDGHYDQQISINDFFLIDLSIPLTNIIIYLYHSFSPYFQQSL